MSLWCRSRNRCCPSQCLFRGGGRLRGGRLSGSRLRGGRLRGGRPRHASHSLSARAAALGAGAALGPFSPLASPFADSTEPVAIGQLNLPQGGDQALEVEGARAAVTQQERTAVVAVLTLIAVAVRWVDISGGGREARALVLIRLDSIARLGLLLLHLHLRLHAVLRRIRVLLVLL